MILFSSESYLRSNWRIKSLGIGVRAHLVKFIDFNIRIFNQNENIMINSQDDQLIT